MSAIELLAQTLGKELTHPTPLRLLALFSERGKLSPKEATEALGDESLGSVSYHVRTLRQAKLLKPAGKRQVRGAIQHFYVLSPAGQKRHDAILELLKEVPMGD